MTQNLESATANPSLDETRRRFQEHKAVCNYRPTAGDRRSGASVCGTCFSLVNQVMAAERRAEQESA